jgi:hypothetical protein
VAVLAGGSLLAVLAEIPDPRERQGRRFSLVAMLAAVVGGILTSKRGYAAIAQWLKAQEPRFWHKLGFTRKPPCPNTFRDLLMALPPEHLETCCDSFSLQSPNAVARRDFWGKAAVWSLAMPCSASETTVSM